MKYFICFVASVLFACLLGPFGWLDHDSPGMVMFIVVLLALVVLWSTTQSWGKGLDVTVLLWVGVISAVGALVIGTRNWSPFMHDVGVEVASANLSVVVAILLSRRLQRRPAPSRS